ncbi:MAG: hypothetical protein AAF432_04545 [Planctomycetota bacterium]
MKSMHALGMLTLVTFSLTATPSAMGQEAERIGDADGRAFAPIVPEDFERERPRIAWSFSGGGEYFDEVALDRGDGEIESVALGFSLSTRIQLDPDTSLSFGGSYVWEQFDFQGTTGLGGFNPWESINTVELSARLAWDMDNNLTIFGGPVVSYSGEDGADFGDSIYAGGFGGLTYEVNDDLVLGGGVGVTSWLEEDARFFPVIIVEWRIDDRSRITSSNYAIRRGLEYQYDLFDDLTIGGGFSYSEKRFRLDDSGVAPGGVGEVQRAMLYGKATLRATDDITLDAIAGVALDGDVDLETSTGAGIVSTGVDDQFFVGVNGSIRW